VDKSICKILIILLIAFFQVSFSSDINKKNKSHSSFCLKILDFKIYEADSVSYISLNLRFENNSNDTLNIEYPEFLYKDTLLNFSNIRLVFKDSLGNEYLYCPPFKEFNPIRFSFCDLIYNKGLESFKISPKFFFDTLLILPVGCKAYHSSFNWNWEHCYYLINKTYFLTIIPSNIVEIEIVYNNCNRIFETNKCRRIYYKNFDQVFYYSNYIIDK